jgi:hypothetical protein
MESGISAWIGLIKWVIGFYGKYQAVQNAEDSGGVHRKLGYDGMSMCRLHIRKRGDECQDLRKRCAILFQ